MFLKNKTTPQQKHGFIVCLPKPSGTQTPEGLRPITFLNADYKILARILVNRLRPDIKGPGPNQLLLLRHRKLYPGGSNHSTLNDCTC